MDKKTAKFKNELAVLLVRIGLPSYKIHHCQLFFKLGLLFSLNFAFFCVLFVKKTLPVTW